MKETHYASINEATARQIVQRTMAIIKHSVNVMDNTGTIIASGDPSRLYQSHQGALLALNENRIIEIDQAKAKTLSGVKPGINLPIFLHNQVVGVVGISGDPEQVRTYAELVKMAAELILEQVAMLTETQWEKRYREELVGQLIEGRYDAERMPSMFNYLNLDIDQPRVVLILEFAIAEPEHVQSLLAYFTDHEPDYLVKLSRFGELVILKPITLNNDQWNLAQERQQIQRLVARLNDYHIVSAIVGGYFAGIEQLQNSYLSAKALQKMVLNRSHKPKYLFYSQQPLPVLLHSVCQGWQAKELTKSWQKLVATDPKGGLRKTLAAYFCQNCDLSQTAKQLHIHVNTLRYRLQKIETITNLKINQLDSLLWLYIGMQIEQ